MQNKNHRRVFRIPPPKNKKAWIRLAEALIAIVLISGVLALVINQSNIGEGDISKQVYTKQSLILKKIQLNSSLRTDILNSIPPISWEEETFPAEVKNKIIEETPADLDCVAKICQIDNVCALGEIEEEIIGDIYVRSVSIFANSETYSPKQLKLFCWKR